MTGSRSRLETYNRILYEYYNAMYDLYANAKLSSPRNAWYTFFASA